MLTVEQVLKSKGSAIVAIEPTATASRPVSQRTRPSGRANSVSSRCDDSSSRIAATCPQPKRLTVSTKKMNVKPR